MRRFGLLVLLLALAAGQAAAAPDCPALFAGGREPVLANRKLGADTIPLCFDAFAVLASGVTRTPLYAAEHLTRESVAAARIVARDDAFHEEDRLPAERRARLEDYVRSGFDRGHLSPAGDMPTGRAQAQSFSLANIVPQNRALNRGLWSDIEETVRRFATRRGSLYVVTGAVFSGGAVREIGGGVLVPTDLFKALYDPATGEAGAYLVPNADVREWRAVSMEEIAALSGIEVFPALPAQARARVMVLPDPAMLGGRAESRREPRDETWRDWLGREFARAVRRAVRDVMRAIF